MLVLSTGECFSFCWTHITFFETLRTAKVSKKEAFAVSVKKGKINCVNQCKSHSDLTAFEDLQRSFSGIMDPDGHGSRF